MGATGTATIDFGTTPASEASIAVTGQGTILTTSLAEAWVMQASTTDNDQTSHEFAGVSFRCVCTIPTAGVGFTIKVTCIAGLATNTFKIQWVWN